RSVDRILDRTARGNAQQAAGVRVRVHLFGFATEQGGGGGFLPVATHCDDEASQNVEVACLWLYLVTRREVRALIGGQRRRGRTGRVGVIRHVRRCKRGSRGASIVGRIRERKRTARPVQSVGRTCARSGVGTTVRSPIECIPGAAARGVEDLILVAPFHRNPAVV